MAESDYILLIAAKIQDTAGKLDAQRKLDALRTAVDEYSVNFPRTKVFTLTGDGAKITFDLPTDYEEGFTQLRSIEYPVDKQIPEFLDSSDFDLYRDPVTSELKLRLFTLTLSVGTKAYLEYTKRHHVTTQNPPGETTADTVPLADRDAVASLASSHCAVMLAAYYAQTSDPTMGADTVDYQNKSSAYLQLSRELRASYNRRIGASDGVIAASAIVDLDVDLQNGLGDRFFHPRRYR